MVACSAGSARRASSSARCQSGTGISSAEATKLSQTSSTNRNRSAAGSCRTSSRRAGRIIGERCPQRAGGTTEAGCRRPGAAPPRGIRGSSQSSVRAFSHQRDLRTRARNRLQQRRRTLTPRGFASARPPILANTHDHEQKGSESFCRVVERALNDSDPFCASITHRTPEQPTR